MKFPTMRLGIPHVSRRIVIEKQQLMSASSFRAANSETVGAGGGPPVRFGRWRRTHEVRTAFWVLSNATWPYF